MTTSELIHEDDRYSGEHKLVSALNLASKAVASLTEAAYEVPETEGEAVLEAAMHGLLPDVHLEIVRSSIDTLVKMREGLVRV